MTRIVLYISFTELKNERASITSICESNVFDILLEKKIRINYSEYVSNMSGVLIQDDGGY